MGGVGKMKDKNKPMGTIEKQRKLEELCYYSTGGQGVLKTINNPRQTHSVSTVAKYQIPVIKKSLRLYGINKFRQVPLEEGYVILCFNADNLHY